MNEEMIRRAAAILEREFGQDWQGIAQALGTENLRRRKPPPAGAFGKELTSFKIGRASCRERGVPPV